MQLALVTGSLVLHEIYSHVNKTKVKVNITRVTENRFFVPLGFEENLITIAFGELLI